MQIQIPFQIQVREDIRCQTKPNTQLLERMIQKLHFLENKELLTPYLRNELIQPITSIIIRQHKKATCISHQPHNSIIYNKKPFIHSVIERDDS